MKLFLCATVLTGFEFATAQERQYLGSVFQPYGPQQFQSYSPYPSYLGSSPYLAGMTSPFYMMPPPLLPPLPPASPVLPATCNSGTAMCTRMKDVESTVSDHDTNIAKLQKDVAVALQYTSSRTEVVPHPPSKSMTCFRNDSSSGRDACSPSSVSPVWNGDGSAYATNGGIWRIEHAVFPDLSVHSKVSFSADSICNAICQVVSGRRLLNNVACQQCFYMDRRDDGLYVMDHCQSGTPVNPRPASSDPRWYLAMAFTSETPVCPRAYGVSPQLNFTNFPCNIQHANWNDCASFDVWKD